MSRWKDQWRSFISQTSYKRVLKEKGWSDDRFWESYPVYDEILSYIGYPGEMLERISSLISSGCCLLDIGAGTGAFALPLSKRAGKVIALDPSRSQLHRLKSKARAEGITNIQIVNASWEEADLKTLGEIDYALSAFSLFSEDAEGFVAKMMDVAAMGAFIVFRAGEMDPLDQFAYGPRASADYICLQHILEDAGWQFRAEIFEREYVLPLRLVFWQYRFSERPPEELTEFLRRAGRLTEELPEPAASFRSSDALLYHLS